ncbi:MAG: hypothetical protein IT422_29050 [Pirellulaceae bacterium]|nr:hypothetical protein [Pirellulaceae bacterium]
MHNPTAERRATLSYIRRRSVGYVEMRDPTAERRATLSYIRRRSVGPH